MQAGKAIVLAFALIIAGGIAVALAYKVQERGEPPVAMRFERAEPPANTTVHALDFRAVHKAFFLEDHLDTALEAGNSTERVRLRVEAMEETLLGLTGEAGPEWWVSWETVPLRIVRS